MPAKDFLSEKDEKRIIQAITDAEKFTTGEIRVHIEYRCKKDPLERAKAVFAELEMHKTDARNGVILYIATDDRKVAIFGDEGISEQVEEDYWQDEIDKLIAEFKQGNFAKGIASVVSSIGEKLKRFYPSDGSDPNELDNEITFEDNRDDD